MCPPSSVLNVEKDRYTDQDVTTKLLQIAEEEAVKGKELELVRYPATWLL